MKERRIEHTYGCSEAVFWEKIFTDDAYNRTLFIEELHFEAWRVVSSEERGGEIHRVVEAVPSLGDLPGALKRLLSDGVGYEERGVLEIAKRRYRLEAIPRSLSGKLSISGELTTSPLGERSCRRTYVARVEARVFGVSGLIEQRLLDDVERSYVKAAVFTNRWITDHGL
jgi:hypothetical protein